MNLNELTKDGVYVIDFYADWCGPCRMQGAELERMEDVNIIKVNVDEEQELAMKYGVMSIPTLMFFKNGLETEHKNIGFMSEEQIRSVLDQIKD